LFCMRKLSFFLFLLFGFSAVMAQNDEKHYDVHPKYRHEATPEERMMIPYLSQQAHLRDRQAPVGPVAAIAEFQPMGGVMISYPLGIPVALVKELSQVIPVKVLVNSNSDENEALSYFSNNQVNMNNIEFWNIEHDSYWVRDYGPWFIVDGQDSVAVVDFTYNRPIRPFDDLSMIYVAENLGLHRYEMPMIHTGGNYMADGYGTAASTSLVEVENPSETTASLMQIAQEYLGIDNYILTIDPPGDYIAHIDCWGKFLDVDKVLIGQVQASDPHYNNYELVAQLFANTVTPWGNHYQVYRVPIDLNAQYATPYSNSLILNDHVFVPITGNSHDEEAIAVYQQAMPGYTIVPIMQRNDIPWLNTDALHCRTHELADRGMLYLKHYPLLGSKSLSDPLNVSVTIKALSGSNLETDSLLVFYRINDGDWQSAPLAEMNVNEYGFDFTTLDLQNGDEVQYYLFAKDESGRREKHPYIGAADPHVFTINGVGIENRGPANVRVWPNPTDNLMFVQLDGGMEIANVALYDLQGRVVETCHGASLQGATTMLDVHNLPAGIYLLRLTDADGNEYHQKIIKK